MAEAPKLEIGFAVLELMGHRRLSGLVRPVELGGSVLLRIDVPTPETKGEEGPWAATQFYSPAAVYCITPCTLEAAVRAAGLGKVEPVARWELPAAPVTMTDVPPDPHVGPVRGGGRRRDDEDDGEGGGDF